MLPAKLRATAERRARARGLSLASLIRLSLERELASGNGIPEGKRAGNDPLVTDNETFSDNWPGDVSSNLDHYLYGDGRDLP